MSQPDPVDGPPLSQSHITDAHAVLEGIEIGVMVQGLDAEILYVNPAALQLLGLTKDEVLGVTSFDPRWNVVHSDGSDFPGPTHPVPQAIATGQAVRGVVMGVYRPRTDDRVWLRVDALPQHDAEGQMTHVLCTFSDISEPQRSLRDAELRYDSVVEAMSEGVIVHGAAGNIRMVNAAAERVLGLSADQLSGRSPLDATWRLVRTDGTQLPPEEIPSEITKRTGEACRQVNLGVHRPNGELAWLSVNTTPFADDPGAPETSGVVATFTDVTAERTALHDAERQRNDLRQVLASLPGVVYRLVRDPQGGERFEFLSGPALQVFGLAPEEMVANSAAFWSRVHPHDLNCLRAIFHGPATGHEFREAELRMRGEDGEHWRWVCHRAVAEAYDGGVRWTGVALDVTESHELSDQLMAAQRREAMGDIAAGVAHNFNNMLCAILPNVELALDSDGGEREAALQDALSAVNSASDLVIELLALARPDSSELSEDSADLAEVTREAMQVCRRTFDRRITLHLDSKLERAPVQGRKSHLQQVVLNLCLNARDALEGRAHPRIVLRLYSEAGEHVVLEVEDNGVGIADDIRGRIGEPFVTTKPAGRGTGLGLATVYRAVAASRGSVNWESSPGQGTCFRLRFPLAGSAGEGDASARDESRATLPARYRVLIVDDEPLVRRGISRLLRGAQCDVEEAADGDSVVPKVIELLADSAHPLRAVFLDLSLPGRSGAELLAELKTRFPQLPVCIMSGHIIEGPQLAAADVLLQKPIRRQQLHAALESLIA